MRLTITNKSGKKDSYGLKDFIQVKERNEPWNLGEKKLEKVWENDKIKRDYKDNGNTLP